MNGVPGAARWSSTPTSTSHCPLIRTIDDAGLWGPVLFVVLMVLLVPLNVPGLLFVVPATIRPLGNLACWTVWGRISR